MDTSRCQTTKRGTSRAFEKWQPAATRGRDPRCSTSLAPQSSCTRRLGVSFCAGMTGCRAGCTSAAMAGETSPLDVALREATEETGLGDLSPWPDAARSLLLHVVIVPVPAGRGEFEHEHADLRYALATARPEDATAETPTARLRWLSIADAMSAVAEDNLRLSFARIGRLLGTPD